MDIVTQDIQERGWPLPGWKPAPKVKVKGGNGLKKRFFDAKPDGIHGESKRGWGPDTYSNTSPKTKKAW